VQEPKEADSEWELREELKFAGEQADMAKFISDVQVEEAAKHNSDMLRKATLFKEIGAIAKELEENNVMQAQLEAATAFFAAEQNPTDSKLVAAAKESYAGLAVMLDGEYRQKASDVVSFLDTWAAQLGDPDVVHAMKVILRDKQLDAAEKAVQKISGHPDDVALLTEAAEQYRKLVPLLEDGALAQGAMEIAIELEKQAAASAEKTKQ
jgi:hypothetical protein